MVRTVFPEGVKGSLCILCFGLGCVSMIVVGFYVFRVMSGKRVECILFVLLECMFSCVGGFVGRGLCLRGPAGWGDRPRPHPPRCILCVELLVVGFSACVCFGCASV